MPSYQAEERIIRAAFALISGDTGLKAVFPVIRLTESLIQIFAYGIGTLVVSGFPVRPEGKPSDRSLISVDIYVCPVILRDANNVDSALVATGLFNTVRKLLADNLPLTDTDGSATDATFDFEWKQTILPQGEKGNLRIPVFVARYQKSIDLITGNAA